jgi:hypothetical protein
MSRSFLSTINEKPTRKNTHDIFHTPRFKNGGGGGGRKLTSASRGSHNAVARSTFHHEVLQRETKKARGRRWWGIGQDE